MTDLELTRLCAEAMGYEIVGHIKDSSCIEVGRKGNPVGFDPLHDDAQAMALAKKFRPIMHSMEPPTTDEETWFVALGDATGEHPDLNRAICLCAAAIQKAKA